MATSYTTRSISRTSLAIQCDGTMRMTLPDAPTRKVMFATGTEPVMALSYARLETMI